MFERYTEDARRTVFFARYEANQLGDMTIEPEHLLLGLLREPALNDLFTEELENARRAVEQRIRRERISARTDIPFSPVTKRILTSAAHEADALNQPYIGSEHLLLGLLREGDPIAAAYLHGAGVRLKAVRERAVHARANTSVPAVQHMLFSAIGVVRSPYQDATSVPRGLGARHDAEGTIEVRDDLSPGLADIEGFSHLYIIWFFDRVEGADLIAYPPSDNRPHGVFATRSPQRPNAIGLTVVELLRREGGTLHVRGVDMLDRTPVLDIKPYLGGLGIEQLRRGWLEEAEKRR